MKYHVEYFSQCLQRWTRVAFAESNTKAYCQGYVDAMDSLYPSQPHRIMRGDEVLYETKGRGRVVVN